MLLIILSTYFFRLYIYATLQKVIDVLQMTHTLKTIIKILKHFLGNDYNLFFSHWFESKFTKLLHFNEQIISKYYGYYKPDKNKKNIQYSFQK